MPYYEFPENEYYALIFAENSKKAKELYKREVGEATMSIKPIMVQPNEAKKQYEDVVVGSEEYDEATAAFEKIKPNQVLLMDGLLAYQG